MAGAAACCCWAILIAEFQKADGFAGSALSNTDVSAKMLPELLVKLLISYREARFMTTFAASRMRRMRVLSLIDDTRQRRLSAAARADK